MDLFHDRAPNTIGTLVNGAADAFIPFVSFDRKHQNPPSQLMLAQAEPENLRHAGLETTERFEHQSLFHHGDDGAIAGAGQRQIV